MKPDDMWSWWDVKMKWGEQAKDWYIALAAARTLEDLILLGAQRGMANPQGWARHVHAARQAKQDRG